MRLFLLCIVMMMLSADCFALKVSTHEDLNLKITNLNLNFNFDAYFTNTLGFEKGTETSLAGERADTIIFLGGKYEDETNFCSPLSKYYFRRYTNHFHNPLKSIADAGYDVFPFTGNSAILWSQWPAGEQDAGGNYSWMDSRNYFYDALTSTDPDTREQKFAATFRSLGQVMHLVQDMSAPAHTRNDFHNAYNYEDRLKQW